MTQLKVTGTYKVVLELHYDWLFYIPDKSNVISILWPCFVETKIKYEAEIQLPGNGICLSPPKL